MSKFWSETVKRTEPYVPGEQLDIPNLLKLNTNENPYPPSPNVVDAIKTELERKLHLYPSPSADQLRESIGAYYNLEASNVFIGNGSDEVLAFSFMAFFESGQKIRFPAVTYSFYPVYAKLFNVPYEEIPLNRDFSIPSEAFFQSEGGVIFPNPNAPTSLYMELETIKDILDNNPDQVVIVDEAYIDFAPGSAVSLINTYDNLLVVQTMSKSRSLAGLRVGFALGNPNLIQALTRIKDSFNSYTIDRLAIAGAESAIRDIEHFKDTTHKIIKTREWITTEMKKRGFYVLPSSTNFIFISHYNYRAEILYTELKNQNILVRHFNKAGIENYLRITIGTDESMHSLLQTLDSIMLKNK
ncbi:histidinol-phosphate transaminase [Virgibacillus salinus]|uniref:Histidinol-phosphate aminotransferase n=1 Tax=Virgibacillus salinus TaxID=553311 RepID=A0A1H1FUK4_9BACI|nr:histidinol-phosphate transaminase [Virgibacillus salinus]SDR04419.1 histidinol phosphate aminotransferase apoenzyme [Virgibacillus salinus]